MYSTTGAGAAYTAGAGAMYSTTGAGAAYTAGAGAIYSTTGAGVATTVVAGIAGAMVVTVVAGRAAPWTYSGGPCITSTAVVGGGAMTCGAPTPATGGAVPRKTGATCPWISILPPCTVVGGNSFKTGGGDEISVVRLARRNVFHDW